MNSNDLKRGPSTGLCLLTVAVGLELLGCGLLFDGPISENIFRSSESQMIVALLLVASLGSFCAVSFWLWQNGFPSFFPPLGSR